MRKPISVFEAKKRYIHEKVIHVSFPNNTKYTTRNSIPRCSIFPKKRKTCKKSACTYTEVNEYSLSIRMGRQILEITVIIFVNLFAFLLFGIILGAVFGYKTEFLLGSLAFSVIPLCVLLAWKIKTFTQDVHISKK